MNSFIKIISTRFSFSLLSFPRTMRILLLLAAVSLATCTSFSVTVEVRPDATVITFPRIEACEGVEFQLQISQRTIRGRVEGGKIVLKGDALQGLDLTKQQGLELRPIEPIGPECPIKPHDVWIANTTLTKTGENTYSVDGSHFRKL
jgi:hypothetical protein